MSIIKVLNQFYIFFFIILLGNFCFAQSSELKVVLQAESLKIDLSQHFRLKEDNVVDTYITESETVTND